MTTLALEFSSECRGLAVIREGRVLAELADTGIRASQPHAAIARVLDLAGLEMGDITDLAVGLGPGSYTGVRIAIALAQGWSLGAPVTTRGVDAFSTLQAAASAEGETGAVTFAIDSQRGEFAVRTWTGTEWEAPPGLVSGLELERRLAAGERITGPAPSRGSVPWVPSGTPGTCPSAAWTGRLAAGLPPTPPELLTAVYLRPVAFVRAPPSRKLDLPPEA